MNLANTVSGLLLVFTLFLGSAASADDTAAANRLFISAVTKWTEAQSIAQQVPQEFDRVLSERELEVIDALVDLLSALQDSLTTITEQHAGSELAVRLIIGEQIGPLSMEGVEAALRRAQFTKHQARSNIAANELVVSATAKWTEAQSLAQLLRQVSNRVLSEQELEAIDRCILLLTETQEILTTIVEHHADSGFAAQLAAGGRIGTLSLAEVEAMFLSAQVALLTAQSNLPANDLVVSAIAKWTEAQSLAPQVPQEIDRVLSEHELQAIDRHIALLTETREILTSIVERYAESGFAAQLAAGRRIGTMSLEEVESALRATCWMKPTMDCLLQMALENASGTNMHHLERAEALRDIAAAQAGAGDIASALETAQGILERGWRASALSAIAAAQADAGDIVGVNQTLHDARETARSIGDHLLRGEALRDVAAVQAGTGDIAGARETARSINEQFRRVKTFAAIAAAQADAGDIAGALETAREIEDAPLRVEHALIAVAAAQAGAGDIAGANQTLREALETARGIRDSESRVRTLSTVATAQAGIGDIAGANQILRNALEMARDIEKSYLRDPAFSAVAAAQAGTGDISSAVEITRGIEDEAWVIRALVAVAGAQANAGDIAGALETAQRIENPSWFANALVAVAVAQANAGDIAGALETAQGIEIAYLTRDSRDDHQLAAYRRDKALSAVAAVQAGSGNVMGSLLTTRGIEHPFLRSSALIVAANALSSS
jgi:tetratricopeptide (TPR) repeat protein